MFYGVRIKADFEYLLDRFRLPFVCIRLKGKGTMIFWKTKLFDK